MGRYAGWIALHSGIASMADAILVPELPYDIERVAEDLTCKLRHGQRHAIVVVAEGAAPSSGEITVQARDAGRAERLGGIGEIVAQQLQDLTGLETRVVVLGHLLRGGSPIALDRLLGLGFGATAVQAAAEGQNGVMVALQGTRIVCVPLAHAISHIKKVPLDGMAIRVAQSLGISLGYSGKAVSQLSCA
jgi:ATP-dependent phosphofructokinase / diphosphate-dependent phosphofructokinase